MPGGQCATYEFTLPKRELGPDDVHRLLRGPDSGRICKAYAYQLERGEQSGYEHYQGRLSLIKKTTIGVAAQLFGECGIHLSPTSNNALKGEAFYHLKEQTRIDGPWTDRDYEQPRVPSNRLVRSGILSAPYPWQQELKERLEVEDDRTVHMVIDHRGNHGKSIFVEWLEYLGLTIEMPGFNSAEDFLQAAMCLPELKVYLVDLPRAMPKKHLNGLFTAIEKLKNGYMCDKRYHFKWKRLLHSPSICVFSNKKPKLKYLSKDRWRIFSISDDHRLIDYCFKDGKKEGRKQRRLREQEVQGTDGSEEEGLSMEEEVDERQERICSSGEESDHADSGEEVQGYVT